MKQIAVYGILLGVSVFAAVAAKDPTVKFAGDVFCAIFVIAVCWLSSRLFNRRP